VLDGGGEYRTTPYVPHVTIGIYDGPHATAEVASRLGRRDDEAIALTVSRIGLYSYAAASLGSPLHLERTIPFSRVSRPARRA
jgi:2'-5' RNA ligase